VISESMQSRYQMGEQIRRDPIPSYRAKDSLDRDVLVHVIPTNGDPTVMRILGELWAIRRHAGMEVIEMAEESSSRIVVTHPLSLPFEQWLTREVSRVAGAASEPPVMSQEEADPEYTALFRPGAEDDKAKGGIPDEKVGSLKGDLEVRWKEPTASRPSIPGPPPPQIPTLEVCVPEDSVLTPHGEAASPREDLDGRSESMPGQGASYPHSGRSPSTLLRRLRLSAPFESSAEAGARPPIQGAEETLLAPRPVPSHTEEVAPSAAEPSTPEPSTRDRDMWVLVGIGVVSMLLLIVFWLVR